VAIHARASALSEGPVRHLRDLKENGLVSSIQSRGNLPASLNRHRLVPWF
jgi:hypothetical protein